jgi:hypothetical protein
MRVDIHNDRMVRMTSFKPSRSYKKNLKMRENGIPQECFYSVFTEDLERYLYKLTAFGTR